MPKPIREVSAFRFYFRCGHKGCVVAENRSVRSYLKAQRTAEISSRFLCGACRAPEDIGYE